MKNASKAASLPAPSPDDTRARVSLGVGAVVIVDRPSIVRTILGSCVAAILHVPRLGLSAVCHAQMPEREAGLSCLDSCPHPCGRAKADANELKYVTCCLRYMLTELHRRQVSHSEIVCTVVGGANVIRHIERRWSVGERNVAMATDLLEGEGIRVAHADTGGTRGRTIEHISDLNVTRVRYHHDLG